MFKNAFKNNMTNIIVACLIVVLFPIVALLIPKNQRTIENAVVNSITGDIAIVYYNYDNGGTIELLLYDIDGNLLLSKSHPSNGGSHSKLCFIGTDIHLYVSRTNASYAYSKEGNSVKAMTSTQWEDVSSKEWIGWESKNNSKKYEMGEYTYCYEKTPYPKSLFNSRCLVQIQNSKDKTNVILLELK